LRSITTCWQVPRPIMQPTGRKRSTIPNISFWTTYSKHFSLPMRQVPVRTMPKSPPISISCSVTPAPAALLAWKNGLAAIDTHTRARFQKSFADCSGQQRQAVMADLVRNELEPRTPLEHFIVEFKRSAIDAFYASQLIQRDHLGYKGNTSVSEFAGCTHQDFDHSDLA
jgi:hypothetical protein